MITIKPNEMYTLTTRNVGHKGEKKIRPQTDFPLPYFEDFENSTIYQPGKYFYDQMGAWEIDQSKSVNHGKVLRQVVPTFPVVWGYSSATPTTKFGPNMLLTNTTKGYNVSLDIFPEDNGAISIIG